MPGPMLTDPLPSHRRATLGVIRLALLAGVLAFGGVTWWMQRRPDWTVSPTTNPETLLRFGYLVFAIAAVGILVVRHLTRRTNDADRYASLAIMGWAVGEAAALYGGVVYFLTGDPSRYGIGLLLMLLSFVLVPLRRG